MVHLARSELSSSSRTVLRPRNLGGWGLVKIEAKCKTLLYFRLQMQGTIRETATSAIMSLFKVREASKNPLDVQRIPFNLPHLRQFLTDMA
jgi:hypothetical protein